MFVISSQDCLDKLMKYLLQTDLLQKVAVLSHLSHQVVKSDLAGSVCVISALFSLMSPWQVWICIAGKKIENNYTYIDCNVDMTGTTKSKFVK